MELGLQKAFRIENNNNNNYVVLHLRIGDVWKLRLKVLIPVLCGCLWDVSIVHFPLRGNSLWSYFHYFSSFLSPRLLVGVHFGVFCVTLRGKLSPPTPDCWDNKVMNVVCEDCVTHCLPDKVLTDESFTSIVLAGEKLKPLQLDWVDWRTRRINKLLNKDVRVGLKLGQIGPKWDKSGIFPDQIQYIFAIDPIWSQIWHRANMH